MGVIDTAPRMATAKALTDSVVVFVSQKEFEKTVQLTVLIHYKFMLGLAQIR